MNLTKRITTLVLALLLLAGNLTITASAASGIMYGIGFVDASSLRLRKEASTASDIVDTAFRKECVVVIAKEGQWYRVNYNLQTGYMHEDYLNVATRENAELGYGKVTGSNVNLRSGPSTSASVVTRASKGDKCYIIGLNEGWYKVIYKDSICYIRSDYLELTEIPYENRDSVNSPKFFRGGKSTGTAPSAAALKGTSSTGSTVPETKPSASGAQILAEAQKYLGTRYVSGGASPSGFDCSGLVYYVLKTLGFSPYRTPASQYKMGTYVDKSNLQPGDIVFFAGTVGSGLSHVGIYAGGGQFIHAPNSRSTVSYSSLTSGYWADHYYGARRVA